MGNAYERLERCYGSVCQRISFKPKAALVLGSGLGDYAEKMKIEETLDYHDIEGFPISTVSGHKGRFVFGYIGDIPVVAMQGRVHYYEGYSMEDVVLPVRLMKRMGAELLILTNAAGGINESFSPGDFMIIRDQITAFVPSPLIGPNIDELGPRFCDMSHVYDSRLRDIVKATAGELGIPVKEGVYLQLTGPEFETPATIRMCRAMGADAVGMSTGCEAVAANHAGMKICGISCISNMGAGMSEGELSNEEVYETTERVSDCFKRLITESVIRMAEEYKKEGESL